MAAKCSRMHCDNDSEYSITSGPTKSLMKDAEKHSIELLYCTQCALSFLIMGLSTAALFDDGITYVIKSSEGISEDKIQENLEKVYKMAEGK